MCDTCLTEICRIFDELVSDYYRDFLRIDEYNVRRPRFMPMDVRNAAESAATKTGFAAMAEAAVGIGYDPGEFLHTLAVRTGLPGQVHRWARGQIPNGLARKIILSCAEDLIREGGAQPTLTLANAA